jgi:hypothetical protein
MTLAPNPPEARHAQCSDKLESRRAGDRTGAGTTRKHLVGRKGWGSTGARVSQPTEKKLGEARRKALTEFEGGSND